MGFVSFDVRMGEVASTTLLPDTVERHRILVQRVFALIQPERVGCIGTSPIPYTALDEDPELIRRVVDAEVQSAIDEAKTIDAVLYDFSANPFEMLREPIMLHLAAAIEQLVAVNRCVRHLINVPSLPGKDSASIQRLAALRAARPEVSLVLTTPAGQFYDLTGPSVGISPLPSPAAGADESLHRLEGRIIRRLGHFRRSDPRRPCRVFSYLSEAATEDYLELLGAWYAKRSPVPRILYDTQTNPSLTAAVKIFAGSRGVPFSRVDEEFAVPDVDRAVMIVDAVETGTRLRSTLRQLRERGIRVHTDILAALCRGTSSRLRVDDHLVSGFLARPAEPGTGPCVQCDLRLPFTSEIAEDHLMLRAFDMWHMTESVGWQREPRSERPKPIGRPYGYIPMFPKLVAEYGDWLAYKMTLRLSEVARPADIFMIHPDERASSALSDVLHKRFGGRLTIVKIPREVLDEGQVRHGAWDRVMTDGRLGLDCLSHLMSARKSNALILDIFNGSGTTFRLISGLLRFYQIHHCGYFPLVDRDPGNEYGERYEPLKLSLYDWYGPRRLRSVMG